MLVPSFKARSYWGKAGGVWGRKIRVTGIIIFSKNLYKIITLGLLVWSGVVKLNKLKNKRRIRISVYPWSATSTTRMWKFLVFAGTKDRQLGSNAIAATYGHTQSARKQRWKKSTNTKTHFSHATIALSGRILLTTNLGQLPSNIPPYISTISSTFTHFMKIINTGFPKVTAN